MHSAAIATAAIATAAAVVVAAAVAVVAVEKSWHQESGCGKAALALAPTSQGLQDIVCTPWQSGRSRYGAAQGVFLG